MTEIKIDLTEILKRTEELINLEIKNTVKPILEKTIRSLVQEITKDSLKKEVANIITQLSVEKKFISHDNKKSSLKDLVENYLNDKSIGYNHQPRIVDLIENRLHAEADKIAESIMRERLADIKEELMKLIDEKMIGSIAETMK